MEKKKHCDKIPSKFEIRSLIKYYWEKGKNPKRILDKINTVYGGGTVRLSRVYYWIGRFCKGNFSVEDKIRTGRPTLDSLDDDIVKLMEEKPFVSAKTLGKHLGHHTSTITRHLKKMCKKRKKLKWQPHQLTICQKSDRVSKAKIMVETLENIRYRSSVWTGDESWIYFDNPQDSIWIGKDEEVPTRMTRSIGSKKLMISVIWSENGIKSISMLPNNVTFNKRILHRNCSW